jgi:hypothetical protein
MILFGMLFSFNSIVCVLGISRRVCRYVAHSLIFDSSSGQSRVCVQSESAKSFARVSLILHHVPAIIASGGIPGDASIYTLNEKKNYTPWSRVMYVVNVIVGLL